MSCHDGTRIRRLEQPSGFKAWVVCFCRYFETGFGDLGLGSCTRIGSTRCFTARCIIYQLVGPGYKAARQMEELLRIRCPDGGCGCFGPKRPGSAQCRRLARGNGVVRGIYRLSRSSCSPCCMLTASDSAIVLLHHISRVPGPLSIYHLTWPYLERHT